MSERDWLSELPRCAIGNYDRFVHKKAADGAYLAQHELDLHEEGAIVLHHAQVKQLKKYIAKYQPKES